MNRRSFVQRSCLTCAHFLTIGALPILLDGCIALPSIGFETPKPILEIDPKQFINEKTKIESKVLLLRPAWLNYDILLVKKSPNDYLALYMKCSHEDYRLTPTENGIFCSAHGSAFDLDGQVKKSPALKPLQMFITEVVDNKIFLHLKA